jgi:hypothetical protein
VYNGGMAHVDEWKTVELEGRTYQVHCFSISDTTVVYEAHARGEPVAGAEAERAIEAAYSAVMQMYRAVIA